MALIKSKQIESLHADKITETNLKKFVTDEQILKWNSGTGSGSESKNIELSKTDTHIVWRIEGDELWNELVALSDITGPAGADGSISSLPNEETVKKISEDIDGNLLFNGEKLKVDIDTSDLATKEELNAIQKQINELKNKLDSLTNENREKYLSDVEGNILTDIDNNPITEQSA